MTLPYIMMCSMAGALGSSLAFVFGHLYYYTGYKPYLLITACLQTCFIMEVINIKLNKSTSRYLPTVLQLSSRMFTLWVVCFYFGFFSRYIPVMVSCWYLNDFIRYVFYAFRNPHIKKLRYSLFLLTCPTSSFCELSAIYCLIKKERSLVRYGLVLVLVVYIPGVIFLMKHMLQQRYWSLKKKGDKTL